MTKPCVNPIKQHLTLDVKRIGVEVETVDSDCTTCDSNFLFIKTLRCNVFAFLTPPEKPARPHTRANTATCLQSNRSRNRETAPSGIHGWL